LGETRPSDSPDIDKLVEQVLSAVSGKDIADSVQKARATWKGVEEVSSQVESLRGDTAALAGKAADVLAEANKCLEDIKKTRNVRVVIATKNGDKKVQGHQHRSLPQLAGLVANKMDAYLYGPPGGGKNHACEQIAKAAGLEFYCLQLSPVSLRSELTGFVSPMSQDPVETPFSLAYAHGGLFMADELDLWNPAIVASVNSALANGAYSFPWGRVQRHEDFVFVGAGNTIGQGATAMHSARKSLDEASRDRMAFLQWDIDEDLELAIATDKGWCRAVQKVRALIQRNNARIACSPRATYQGETLLAMGWSFTDVVNSVILRGEKVPGFLVEVIKGAEAGYVKSKGKNK